MSVGSGRAVMGMMIQEYGTQNREDAPLGKNSYKRAAKDTVTRGIYLGAKK